MKNSLPWVLPVLSMVSSSNAASYSLTDNYDSTNFFDEFSYFTGADPMSGFVDYAAGAQSNSGLANTSNGTIFMGVDHTTSNPVNGRGSVRVTSNKAYTHGLFIADIKHMPGSICGVWPAFWTFGPNWPASGEIDIIEGVSQQTTDSITLHTSSDCSMQSTGSLSTSTLSTNDCNANDAKDGCSFSTASTQGYGDGFNANGGGVYAMEWTSDVIQVWFFPRGSIPEDLTSGSPDPSSWSTPTAKFAGSCDIDSHFMNHNIIFDTTFCEQWAGGVWDSGSCASKADTCQDYVAQNPSAFVDAYWEVNSVKVYQGGSNSSVSTKRGFRQPLFFSA